MTKIVPILTMAVVLGFATPLLAEEKAIGPSGFSTTSGSEGKTGESAECPIKKNHQREDDLLSERPGAYQAARW